MKDLKKLKGAKVISKMEQKLIRGGAPCFPDGSCPFDMYCCGNICTPMAC